MEILGIPYTELIALFENRYRKGRYHAEGLFRHMYKTGKIETLGDHPHFHANPALAARIREDYAFALPEISRLQEDGRTRKFTLTMPDGEEIESVLIPMHYHTTLCVSSQVGCARGCAFCETAKMGLVRDLKAEEIVAQILRARFTSKTPMTNLVFMGMGEPLDNFDAVTRAILVVSAKRGLNIPTARMTISTCGTVPGIRKLVRWMGEGTLSEERHALRLAVSLNAPNDAVRDRLMPINRSYDMAALKNVLQEFPVHHKEERLFVEYVLIPGETTGREAALELIDYLQGLRVSLNLIKYNPGRNAPWRSPSREEVDEFCRALLDNGQSYRIRDSRGDKVMAACGQLRPGE